MAIAVDDTGYKKGENYLFTISIDDYQKGVPKLQNCVRDADSFRNILIKKYQFDIENTIVLKNKEATRRNIFNKIKDIRKRIRKRDNLIIYFSGHGMEMDSLGFLLPFDAQPLEDHNYISTSELLDRLSLINCHHLLLIIDACFAGKIFINPRSNFARGDEKKASRAGFSACHSREVAYDGTAGENSPFADSLLNELQATNRPLPFGELAASVVNRVQDLTEGKQTPIYRPIRMKGDKLGQFIFYPKSEYYQFNEISFAIERQRFDEAKLYLKKYLISSESLPKNFEFLLCLPKNQLLRIHELTRDGVLEEKKPSPLSLNLEADLQNIIYNFRPEGNLQFIDSWVKEYLTALAFNKLDGTILALKKNVVGHDFLENDLTTIYIRFKYLEYCLKKGLIQPLQYEELYTEALGALIALIRLLGRPGKRERFRSTEYVAKLLQESKRQEAITVMNFIAATHLGPLEDYYLIRVLRKNLIEVLRDRISYSYEEFETSFTKVDEAINFLLVRFDKNNLEKKNKEYSENSGFLQPAYLELRERQDTNNGSSWLHVLVPGSDAFYEGLFELIFERIGRADLANSFLWGSATKLISDFVASFFFEDKESSQEEGQTDQTDHFGESKRASDLYHQGVLTISEIKKLVARGQLEEAMELTQNFADSGLSNLALRLLREALNASQEDQLFFDKDMLVTGYRRSSIISKFLELLDDLKKDG